MAEIEMITTDVLVSGAGPAGLLLTRELQLAGVANLLIDKLPRRSRICRGFTLNARSLDILARRNILGPFLEEGWKAPHAAFSLPIMPMLEGTATDHPYSLGIGQDRVEQLLEEQTVRSGARVHWGHELTRFEQDDGGVTATVRANGEIKQVRARYLVGCDGSRSVVRKQAGIEFPGTAAKRIMLLADIELAEPDSLSLGVNQGPGGTVFVIPRPGYVRILFRDPHPPNDKDTPVRLEEFTAALCGIIGRTIAIRNPRWLTRFGDAARQAARYVEGRVLLVGDAAHVQPPAGAIGVNVALDDAFNLGWKLAATVLGSAPSHLLETYHRERHTAGKHVLENTQAQVLLGENSEEIAPMREFLKRFLRRKEVNRALAEVVTCLDTHYSSPGQTEETHPWLGKMVPNFSIRTASKDIELTTLLAVGRGLIIDATPGAQIMHLVKNPSVEKVHMQLRPKQAPSAILVRPDGHAAWVSTDVSSDVEKLHEAVTYWFGCASDKLTCS